MILASSKVILLVDFEPRNAGCPKFLPSQTLLYLATPVTDSCFVRTPQRRIKRQRHNNKMHNGTMSVKFEKQ